MKKWEIDEDGLMNIMMNTPLPDTVKRWHHYLRRVRGKTTEDCYVLKV